MSTNNIRSTTTTSKMRMISNLALGRSWGPSCHRGLSSSILKEEKFNSARGPFECFYLWLMMSGQRRSAVSVSPSNWEQRSKVDLLGLLLSISLPGCQHSAPPGGSGSARPPQLSPWTVLDNWQTPLQWLITCFISWARTCDSSRVESLKLPTLQFTLHINSLLLSGGTWTGGRANRSSDIWPPSSRTSLCWFWKRHAINRRLLLW